jgi:hypothetical protein
MTGSVVDPDPVGSGNFWPGRNCRNKSSNQTFLTSCYYHVLFYFCVLATPLLRSAICSSLVIPWIRTQRAVVARKRATNLATHLPKATDLPK